MRAIFISYRRDDAEGQAGRLFEDLQERFGKASVFMDVTGIEPGRDFRKVIEQQVASCGVLLALIGKDWLDAKDQDGRRRLDDPADFVRLETAAALKRDIPVIPVLVRGARMPRSEQLPEGLADLAYRNCVELTHARWSSDVELLIDALLPHVDVSNAERTADAAVVSPRHEAASTKPARAAAAAPVEGTGAAARADGASRVATAATGAKDAKAPADGDANRKSALVKVGAAASAIAVLGIGYIALVPHDERKPDDQAETPFGTSRDLRVAAIKDSTPVAAAAPTPSGPAPAPVAPPPVVAAAPNAMPTVAAPAPTAAPAVAAPPPTAAPAVAAPAVAAPAVAAPPPTAAPAVATPPPTAAPAVVNAAPIVPAPPVAALSASAAGRGVASGAGSASIVPPRSAVAPSPAPPKRPVAAPRDEAVKSSEGGARPPATTVARAPAPRAEPPMSATVPTSPERPSERVADARSAAPAAPLSIPIPPAPTPRNSPAPATTSGAGAPIPTPLAAAPMAAPPAPVARVETARAGVNPLLGDPASPAMATRTIVIRPDTTHVNVTGGEIVKFMVGDRAFAWNFSGRPSTLDLSTVAPPGLLDRKVIAYIAANPLQRMR